MDAAIAAALRSPERWSPAVGARLERMYAAGPGAPAVRARRLRVALTANYLRVDAAAVDLYLLVPCSSYDDALTLDSLAQVVEAVRCNVFVVLLLPDAAAVECAIARAARDQLSRLLYFVDGATAEVPAVFGQARERGAVCVLRHAEALPAEVLAQTLDASRRQPGQAWRVEEGAAPLQALAAAVPAWPSERGAGFRVHLAATGELLGISQAWLEKLASPPRSEPLLLAHRGATRRIWFDLADSHPLGAGPLIEPDPMRQLDPLRVTCFANRGGPGNDLIFGFALGHGCRLAYAEEQRHDDAPGTSLVWGVLRGSDAVVRASVAAGRSFIYCDHAYFGRGHLRNYRVILDGHATTTLRRCADDRTDALGVELRPWRAQGRHVLVCPPTDHFMKAHDCPNWLANTVSTLRNRTDRPIVVRDKPKAGEAARTLFEDLQDCHALVTHSSNVAVEAAVHGVPVFVAPGCAAIGVGTSDLRRIEQPPMPDRRLWLANLSHTQFTFDEVVSGRVLGLMADYWSCEAVA